MGLSKAMDFDYFHIRELPSYFTHYMIRVAFIQEVPFLFAFMVLKTGISSILSILIPLERFFFMTVRFHFLSMVKVSSSIVIGLLDPLPVTSM